MDSVAVLDADERRVLFTETATRAGFAPWIAEKDFWVCWALAQLFALPEHRPRLLFKGGTTLSKVFRVIERFSEDIDLSVNRVDLGFVGDHDPEELGGKARKIALEELSQAVRDYVCNDLLPELRERFSDVLGEDRSWALEPIDGGPHLRFAYPISTQNAGTIGYVSQSVNLEIGGKSDHEPADEHTVSPYAQEHFPELFQQNAVACVRVMAAERTFWEKATILHAHYHGGAERAAKGRLSRHYYDLVQLSRAEAGDRALADLDLLDRVALHKSIYHRSAWANYETARQGTLRLLPSDESRSVIERDYEDMQRSGYFFGPVPSFSEMVDRLAEIESAINGK